MRGSTELEGFFGMNRVFISKYKQKPSDSSEHASDMILFKSAWAIMQGTDQKGAKRVEEGKRFQVFFIKPG